MRYVRIALAFVVAVGTIIAILHETSGTSDSSAQISQIIHVEGYPLDRSPAAMIADEHLDFAFVLTQVSAGAPHWNTPNNEVPAYIVEQRAPSESEGQANAKIVTPITATVRSVAFGRLGVVGDTVTFDVVGGQVETVLMEASPEIAPVVSTLTSGGDILVAGRLEAETNAYQVMFAFSIGKTRLTSLFESVGGGRPAGSLITTLEALAAKPPTGDRR